jgi:hypothetical protein
MADPNQTPGPERFHWACPCAGCTKATAYEREQLIQIFEEHKNDYLIYRGSSFNQINGSLFWAKDDAAAYAEGIDSAISIIKSRMPQPKKRK